MQVIQRFVVLALFISYASPQSTPVFGKLAQTISNGRFGKNSATTQNSNPATIQSKNSAPDTTFTIEKDPKTGKLDLVITERQLVPMDSKFPTSPEASEPSPSKHSPLAMEVIRLLDSGIRDNEIDIIDPHTGKVLGKLSHQKTSSGTDQTSQYPERNLPGPSYPMKLPLKERYDARQSYPEYKTDNQLHTKDFKINLVSQVQNDLGSNNAMSVSSQLNMPVILDFSNALPNENIVGSTNSNSPVIPQIPTDQQISHSRLQSSLSTKKNSQNLERSVSSTAKSLAVSPAWNAIIKWVQENANLFKTMTNTAKIILSKHSKRNNPINRNNLPSNRKRILSRGSRGHAGENRPAQKQFIMKPYKVHLLSFNKSPSGQVKGGIFEADKNRLSATRAGRPNHRARTSRKGGY
ncbi:Hypothetical predicted protein [Mytilus galloprovincialis]|nr:Hypothetical predicted protein [Mytilus galloprovincialis]